MELSGKVIIFENREEAEKWFKLIGEVRQEEMYQTAMQVYENKTKQLEE